MTAPTLVNTRAELAAYLAKARTAGQRIGFVPTMGALHAGHASLMTVARERVVDGPVVVSVFVNPTQFAPGEDLDRYPRTLQADLELCGERGVDVVFAPAVDEVYPHGSHDDANVTVAPGSLSGILEGSSRPTHFAGVLTVVAKLFGLVRPDVAVFGEKDYQQLTLIRRMVDDLCWGIDVVGAQTVREADGLAMSSRNRYLDADQRRDAAALSAALRAARDAGGEGPQAALAAAHDVLRSVPGVDLDYLVLQQPDLSPLPDVITVPTPARALIAARVGSTRLIDNLGLTVGAAHSTSH